VKLRNLRPDAFDIFPVDKPDIHVEAGGEFEVDDELGASLLEQEGNYERVDKSSRASKKDEEA